MKRIFTALLLITNLLCLAQNGAPANPYYIGFDWTLNGAALKSALATKIQTTHTNLLTYGQAENALKIVDRDPTDLSNVLLIYGFSSNICTYTDESNYGTFPNWNEHRKRNKEADQVYPATECMWNREHVYAKSRGTPNLDDSYPSAGTDAHHIRTADVDRNTMRYNRKFAEGSGISAIVGAYWYPGDEWKGDVARMMMYMYLRYPSQCKPTNIGTGATVSTDTSMIQLFLQWNADDPVSQYEDNRNSYLGDASNYYGQGNRNPFIDNPYLATIIWGGPIAENRWPEIFLGTSTFDFAKSVTVYPNPTRDNAVNISTNLNWAKITITNISGQITKQIDRPEFIDQKLQITDLTKGFYFITMTNNQASVTKKLVVD